MNPDTRTNDNSQYSPWLASCAHVLSFHERLLQVPPPCSFLLNTTAKLVCYGYFLRPQ